MTWIDIEENLPEHMQKVVIKGHFPFSGCRCTFIKHEDGFEFTRKSTQFSGLNISIYGVTHWKEDNDA